MQTTPLNYSSVTDNAPSNPAAAVASQSPISAFRPPHPDTTGNSNDRRLAAAQRSLPQHQWNAVPWQRGNTRSRVYTRGAWPGNRGRVGMMGNEFSLLPNTEFLAICLPFTV